jgi:hypothetical protein
MNAFEFMEAASKQAEAVSLNDFVAYMPTHSYIFRPTGETWSAASINARVPPIGEGERKVSASAWLDKNSPVEQLTWAPGLPTIIADKLISDGGWFPRPGCRVFNLYRPPTIAPKAGDPSPWLDHLWRVYPDDAGHIVRWLAQRIQRPHEKINHALVLGGAPGIGKDTILEPVKVAVGPWNWCEVSPSQVMSRFNAFAKSVILRISEARDLGEVDRFAFHDHLKVYEAAPPDVLRVDEKFRNEYAVLNICGVIITTNHLADGIYLPTDDRRHFVAWSERGPEDFGGEYWSRLYRWYSAGGNEIVAHHLANVDLSDFDAKAPPLKTDAFWRIVDSGRATEDAEIADALDKLGNPPVVTLQQIINTAPADLGEWLRDRKNARKVPYRLEQCDYVPVRNPDSQQGLWVIAGKRQAVYGRKGMALRDQIKAVNGIIGA